MKHSDLGRYKQKGEKITCLTAYDASMASLIDSAGVDTILIGDSLGMVIQGAENTRSVSMEERVLKPLPSILFLRCFPYSYIYQSFANCLGVWRIKAYAVYVRITSPRDIAMFPIMTGLLGISMMLSLNLDVISQSLQKDYTISFLDYK